MGAWQKVEAHHLLLALALLLGFLDSRRISLPLPVRSLLDLRFSLRHNASDAHVAVADARTRKLRSPFLVLLERGETWDHGRARRAEVLAAEIGLLSRRESIPCMLAASVCVQLVQRRQPAFREVARQVLAGMAAPPETTWVPGLRCRLRLPGRAPHALT